MAPRILVVDDEEDIVEYVSYNLQLEGYEVFRAANGMEALNQARLHLPDLILLDLMLPDMDGFSVCEILHCQPSTTNIPVIVLTAMAGELPRRHGFEVGAADYCLKPVRPRDLRVRVKNALETCAGRAAELEESIEGAAAARY